jgi:hypothetical protein
MAVRSILIGSVSLFGAGYMTGCGSSAKHDTTAGETAVAKTPATHVSRQVVARDRALGERALLRESDFPSEYAAVPRGPKEPPQEERATHLLQMAANCMRSQGGATSYTPLDAAVLANENPATVSEEVGEVGEPPHPKGYVTIESTVTVEPTVAAAERWFSILGQPQVASCIGEADRTVITKESAGLQKPGNSVGKARVARLSLPRRGDQTVAYRLIRPVIAEGHQLNFYLDYVLVRKSRAHVMLTFTRVDSPVGDAMERRLTALTARRLRG